MAAKAKKASKPAVEWVIPIKFMDGIHEFLIPLYDEIFDGAVARAQARGGVPYARVSADDVIVSARNVVPAALARFEKKLKHAEADHARQKAS
jgi:hypothetical protein